MIAGCHGAATQNAARLQTTPKWKVLRKQWARMACRQRASKTVRMAASRTDYWSSASLRKSICCDPISALHRLAGTADLE